MSGMRMRNSERETFNNSNFGTMTSKIPAGYRAMAINHDGTVDFYSGSHVMEQISSDSEKMARETELYEM